MSIRVTESAAVAVVIAVAGVCDIEVDSSSSAASSSATVLVVVFVVFVVVFVVIADGGDVIVDVGVVSIFWQLVLLEVVVAAASANRS